MKGLFFHGNRRQKQIALTFDDGPCERTLDILKVLKKYNAKATFFVLGKKVKKNGSILKKIIKEGHEIGNHTYNHKSLIFKSRLKIREEISNTDNELLKFNMRTKLLRFPYLRSGLNAMKVAKELNKKIILVDVDSRDWLYKDKEKIIKRVLNKTKNGSIIGFHDYLEDIGKNKYVVPSLELILPEFKKRGYKMVNVSKIVG